MATDYYSDESSDTPSSNGAAQEAGADDTSPETETALLPKSIFGDKELEIGSECKFKIVHVFDDEVEVRYIPMDKSEDSGKPEMDNAMAGMDSMASDQSET